MKSKSPAANCFLQLLAHREKGRTRQVAWAIVKNVGGLGASASRAGLVLGSVANPAFALPQGRLNCR